MSDLTNFEPDWRVVFRSWDSAPDPDPAWRMFDLDVLPFVCQPPYPQIINVPDPHGYFTEDTP